MTRSVTALTSQDTAAVLALVADEESRTGRRPLDEVNRLALSGLIVDDRSREQWVQGDTEVTGYAVMDAAGVAELSAIDLQHATSLLTRVRRSHPGGRLWAHGDRSAAHLAAAELGLTIERELLLLARGLPVGHPDRPLPAGVRVTSFDPEVDADDWLALNRAAFVDLPDQAGWTRADLDLRVAAPWFDADDCLVARGPDGAMAGFHWTKVDPDAAAGDEVSGEVFVIAVAPQWTGTGLAAALLDRGLSHLAARGLRQVHLFVDADNTRAVALYERAGFARVDADRLYRL